MKARKCWDRVGKVLWNKNVSPRICRYFYKAVVQAVLLFGNETCNLSLVPLVWLEGFYIQCAHWMTQRHKPKYSPGNVWAYPYSPVFLMECGLRTIEEYICHRWQMVVV